MQEPTQQASPGHASHQQAVDGVSTTNTPAAPSQVTTSQSSAVATPVQESPPGKQRRKWLTELKRGPMAAAGAIAGVLALVPIVVSALQSAGEDPIAVHLSPIDFRAGQATSPDLVVPVELNKLDRPPVPEGETLNAFFSWVRKHRAVRANEVGVSFVARSDEQQPTLIVGARVRVTRREAPLAGTWIAPDGAGPQPNRLMYVNLDTNPPTITKDQTWDFPLNISQTEVEAFTVVARTTNCHCFWTIELDALLPDGGSKTVLVNDNGNPFELTSASNASSKTYLPRTSEDPWPRS